MGYPFKVGTEFRTDQCVTDHSPCLRCFIDNFFYLIRMTDKGHAMDLNIRVVLADGRLSHTFRRFSKRIGNDINLRLFCHLLFSAAFPQFQKQTGNIRLRHAPDKNKFPVISYIFKSSYGKTIDFIVHHLLGDRHKVFFRFGINHF